MWKLLAAVAVAGIFAIGCNEQPTSKPTTTTNPGAQKVAPAHVKPQSDTPPTGTSGSGKTDSEKKDNGNKGPSK
jgi:hypothetical protein